MLHGRAGGDCRPSLLYCNFPQCNNVERKHRVSMLPDCLQIALWHAMNREAETALYIAFPQVQGSYTDSIEKKKIFLRPIEKFF